LSHNQFASPDYNYNFYLLSGDSIEKIVKLDLPPPFDIQQRSDNTITCILGSAVNDTLCIYDSTIYAISGDKSKCQIGEIIYATWGDKSKCQIWAICYYVPIGASLLVTAK
jgi:hypothetical protein